MKTVIRGKEKKKVFHFLCSGYVGEKQEEFFPMTVSSSHECIQKTAYP